MAADGKLEWATRTIAVPEQLKERIEKARLTPDEALWRVIQRKFDLADQGEAATA